MQVLCLYFGTTSQLKNIAELFYQLTPQIALRGNEAIFLERTQGHRLLSEESFLKRALVLLRKFNLAPRYAFAEDPGTALAFCKFHTMQKNLLPLEALQCYLEPFRTDSDYDAAFAKMIPHLQRLGIRTVREFLTLSPSSLPSRFGPVGLHLFMRLHSSLTPPWPAFIPEESIKEGMEFREGWCFENLDGLLFYLKLLFDRSQIRLRAKGVQARQMELILNRERDSILSSPICTSSICKIEIDLSQYPMNPKALLSLAKEKLNEALQKNPFLEVIGSLELRILEQTPIELWPKGTLSQSSWERALPGDSHLAH